MPEYTRRAFLGLAASAAVCIGLGGSAKALGHDGDLLRPPGAQDAAAFFSACVRCDRCRSVCPQGCISVGTLADSIMDVRAPKLDFHLGYCDFCMKCLDVCPTVAIQPFDPETQKIGVAIVQSDKCIAYSSGCIECFNACPYDAISLDGAQRPVVEPSKCNGCGVCEAICPALVYRSTSGGDGRRGIQIVSESRYRSLGVTVATGKEMADA